MPLISAAALQQNLIETHNGAVGQALRTPVGTLQALMSLENTANVKPIEVQIESGKVKTVVLKYFTRDTSTDVTTNQFVACGTCIEDTQLSTTVEVSLYARSCAKLTIEEMRKAQDGDTSLLMQILQKKINAIVNKINFDASTYIAANIGIYQDTSVVKSFDFINGANEIQPVEVGKLLEEYALLELDNAGRPIIVGYGDVSIYTKAARNHSTPFTANGVATTGLEDYSFYHDKGLVSTFPVDNCLMMAPGSVQMVGWEQYKGVYEKQDGEIYQQHTIVDPYTGLALDFKLIFNPCIGAGDWEMRLEKYYNFVAIPTNAIAAGDSVPVGARGTVRFQMI